LSLDTALKIQTEPRLKGILVTSWALRLNPLETKWPLLNLPNTSRVNPDTSWQEAIVQSCNGSFSPQIPDFAAHWKTLGQSFYLAESHLCLDWESGYVGQMPPAPQLLSKRFVKDDEICPEMERVEGVRQNIPDPLLPFVHTCSVKNQKIFAHCSGVSALTRSSFGPGNIFFRPL
jgi:hypothetical protein